MLARKESNNLIVRNGQKRIEDLRSSMEESFARGLLPSYEAPLEHYVTGELYGRRVFVDAGATIITKVHDTKHITVTLKGTCTVYGQDGSRTIIESPNVFITDPGTQRAIYCHDEVQWLTVHATLLSDVDDIEKSKIGRAHV